MTFHRHGAFELLAAFKRFRALILAPLAELGLVGGQEFLLAELWQENGLCQRALVERMGVEQPTVAKMVKRLEAAGVVRREGDAQDARLSRVWLTERGLELREPVERAWREVDEAMGSGMTDAERRQLVELLRRSFR